MTFAGERNGGSKRGAFCRKIVTGVGLSQNAPLHSPLNNEDCHPEGANQSDPAEKPGIYIGLRLKDLLPSY